MTPFRTKAAAAPLGPERARHTATTKPVVERAASRMSLLLLGNNSWELFEGIPKHYSLRTRVRMKLQLSSSGFVWEICQTLFALVASLLYVAQTYDPALATDTFDIVALVVFSCDYLLNLYCAESRLRYVVSFMAIMDLVTIVPAAVDRITHHGPQDSASNNNVGSSFPFLRFIRVLRLLRLTRLIRAAGTRSTSAVQKQIHTIVLLITCIVFISAGVFHAVESANRAATDPPISFGDALYFLLVTMATVGYGDIAPLTSSGKAVAVAVIVLSFTIIPREITRLNQLMGLQSQFRRFYHPSAGNPHILVVGHVTNERALLDFFMEMYHPDRQLVHSADLDLTGTDPFTDPPCVVMGPEEPSEAMINLLDHPLLQNRVTYIKGSVMSEEDLCRVGADAARACFVLTPKSCENAMQTDAETVLRLLAIRNYNADLEIYTQMVSPLYSDYISEVDADHVLCINEIKLRLMAKSCLCPGLVTLVSNMFRSSSIANAAMQTYTGWQKEYVEGVAMEVYATKLPTAFYGLSFAQACDVVYQCFNGEVIMLGVFEPSSMESLGRRHVAATGGAADSASAAGNAGGVAVGAGAGVQLPNLKVQALHPSLAAMSSGSRSNLRDNGASSQMYVNPGHAMRMGSGQIVYMLSESKRLTHSSSIAQRLEHWLSAGNKMPLPIATVGQGYSMAARPRAVDASHITPAMHAPSRARTQADVLLEDAVHPHTGHAIENHIIVVTDLDHVTMDTFVHLLRLSDHTREHAEYHAILFLSWSKTKSVATACRALQDYDDVFVMMARQETSKTEFLRANILKAARCVLLSDKSLVVQLDGAAIDAQTIFHYLAILSIQSEYGVDTTSGLMPIVELAMPRTMKILDTALKKRTLRSYLHRQQIDSLLRKAANRHDSELLASKSRWTTTRLMQQLMQQGADNISSLENSIRLRKQLQKRHSHIRQQDTSANRSATFDTTGTALLPFFAAGYGFSDDVFDNMLCQSYFTPGLVRFIYALLFTKNGGSCRRAGSSQLRSLARGGAGEVGGDHGDSGLGIGSDAGDANDDDDDSDGRVVASSIVQIPVPISFVAKTFGELFVYLVQVEQVVAVALYRGSGVPFSLPYVACGPATDTVLLKDDLVFVLAQPASYERLNRPHEGTDAASDPNADKPADVEPSPSGTNSFHSPRDGNKPNRRQSADSAWRHTIQQLVLNTSTQ